MKLSVFEEIRSLVSFKLNGTTQHHELHLLGVELTGVACVGTVDMFEERR